MKKIFAIVLTTILALVTLVAVSYTHLDVYKRQGYTLQIEQPEFELESLCISVVIDAFASGGECTQTAAELN